MACWSDMVVSGIPKLNGVRHAREICHMSLDLRDASSTFVIPHMPQEKLKIRIGVHSGQFSVAYFLFSVSLDFSRRLAVFCGFSRSLSLQCTIDSRFFPKAFLIGNDFMSYFAIKYIFGIRTKCPFSIFDFRFQFGGIGEKRFWQWIRPLSTVIDHRFMNSKFGLCTLKIRSFHYHTFDWLSFV